MTSEAVSDLDKRYQRNGWNMYRSAIGEWVVSIGRGGDQVSICAATIEGALAAALEYRPILKIPRRPDVPARTRVVRDDTENTARRWRVEAFCSDSPHWWSAGLYARTKREAESHAEKAVVRARAARDEWDAQWAATVSAGVEGVDWVWR